MIRKQYLVLSLLFISFSSFTMQDAAKTAITSVGVPTMAKSIFAAAVMIATNPVVAIGTVGAGYYIARSHKNLNDIKAAKDKANQADSAKK